MAASVGIIDELFLGAPAGVSVVLCIMNWIFG